MKFCTFEITNGYNLRRFIELPWKIYKDYPKWIPPLIVEMRNKLDPRKNPFFEYGQVKLFGVCNESHEMVGRIAAIFNPVYCEIHHEQVGFFGLFECINDVEVAHGLIRAVSQYLGRYGCSHFIGPVNFTTNDEAGVLIEGFDERPMLMCTYSPPYYDGLLKVCGCERAMDLLSYEGKLGHVFPQKYLDVLNKVSENNGMHVRHFNRNQFLQEIATIREIYNGSFKGVWGFVPLSSSEAEAMGRNFISFSDDELVWIAEYENKPAGLVLALPDVNEILKDLNGRLLPSGIFKFLLRRRHLHSVRVIVLCVLPVFRSLGIDTLLIHKLHQRILAGGYQRAEFSVVNENNTKMRSILEAFGFQVVKRYRIYQAPISDLSNSKVEHDTAALSN